MQIYLVGGAVRDKLLSLPVKDRDWVVVGSTPKELLKQGFHQVGADFPVFLHPESKEEYALARTERKSGTGYTGFKVNFNKDVTLDEDLLRRDLTINAMAQTKDGEIIDPFNGQSDITSKKLRHVSEAFREDPLRILRTARFAARFAHLGFEIAEETEALMKQMVSSGELSSLVAERVWSEMSRALTEVSPQEFFKVLRRVGALKIIFPELDRLFGIPQKMHWHPEVDTGIHTLKTLEIARQKTAEVDVLMATVCHDLGKGLTPADIVPGHHQHESAGADLIKTIAKKYKWPSKVAQLCELVARYHTHAHTAFTLRPTSVVKLFNNLGAFKQSGRLESFLMACEADSRGRSGFEGRDYPQSDYLKSSLESCLKVTAETFIEQGLEGKKIGDAIQNERCKQVAILKKQLQMISPRR